MVGGMPEGIPEGMVGGMPEGMVEGILEGMEEGMVEGIAPAALKDGIGFCGKVEVGPDLSDECSPAVAVVSISNFFFFLSFSRFFCFCCSIIS
jgi:hypothetical protein